MENEKVTVDFCKCRMRSRCPSLHVEGDKVTLGGKEEGYTHWTREHLADFIQSAKEGDFDEFCNPL